MELCLFYSGIVFVSNTQKNLSHYVSVDLESTRGNSEGSILWIFGLFVDIHFFCIFRHSANVFLKITQDVWKR